MFISCTVVKKTFLAEIAQASGASVCIIINVLLLVEYPVLEIVFEALVVRRLELLRSSSNRSRFLAMAV